MNVDGRDLVCPNVDEPKGSYGANLPAYALQAHRQELVYFVESAVPPVLLV